jgi:hypothetical protein
MGDTFMFTKDDASEEPAQKIRKKGEFRAGGKDSLSLDFEQEYQQCAIDRLRGNLQDGLGTIGEALLVILDTLLRTKRLRPLIEEFPEVLIPNILLWKNTIGLKMIVPFLKSWVNEDLSRVLDVLRTGYSDAITVIWSQVIALASYSAEGKKYVLSAADFADKPLQDRLRKAINDIPQPVSGLTLFVTERRSAEGLDQSEGSARASSLDKMRIGYLLNP